ncbi:MAG: tRNA preQ1(34) S-adenosylmethionine ribosyltransferase-isomerase QueA [Clostridiales Family XIII bacterium]|jgi:S-adenosylmethionine:tRNA ribosyltransferase-isomerase|nr:tRNA preQ1(34) S-adenosylmethionine ribosyltransferase-isomerase QueA [Clostridiales Family XIII bacterium]
MQLNDFDYELPPARIAQYPVAERDESRLMVIRRDTGEIEHRRFYDLPSYLRAGDCLVLNDSKVLPARLSGVREGTGAKVECLLVRRLDGDVWECMVRPGKRLRRGDGAVFRAHSGRGEEEAALRAEILDYGADGTRRVRFRLDGDFVENLEKFGTVPIPPYIDRAAEALDALRYQTVYSNAWGSVAAPTAGLHFTEKLLEAAADRGVRIARVTLHVGPGTFKPVKAADIRDHHMHREEYEIGAEAAAAVNEAKAGGGRVICVGTTSARTLESAAAFNASAGGFRVDAGCGSTEIFIYPGYPFKMADVLLTNFHLPKSTLLMLVSAFYDREKLLQAYQTAIEKKYRFFSYGDAMLLL